MLRRLRVVSALGLAGQLLGLVIRLRPPEGLGRPVSDQWLKTSPMLPMMCTIQRRSGESSTEPAGSSRALTSRVLDLASLAQRPQQRLRLFRRGAARSSGVVRYPRPAGGALRRADATRRSAG